MDAERIRLGLPDYVRIEAEEGNTSFSPQENVICQKDFFFRMIEQEDGELVSLSADHQHVRYVKLHWNREIPTHVRSLSDAWERGYGDLEWRGLSSRRFMPWYFLATSGDVVYAYGVMVRPSAMCYWLMDSSGISLILDVRCGGNGVTLHGRLLDMAVIVAMEAHGVDSFEAAAQFCRMMCHDPILPPFPVYGSNNWYYAYGESSEEEILEDADYILKLTQGAENPPFMVIDDGWQECRNDEYIGGPWKCGNGKFPDMKRLAEQLKAKGLHTGIWLRPLLNRDPVIPDEWRLPHNGCLDPSHPDALAYIQEDIRRIGSWGYELIKHDFSTFDLFGLWGFEMNPSVTKDGWHFYDGNRTSAEIVKLFYQAIFDATQESHALILGCNTVGHLGAGLMHLNRTGDDTSGLNWERTRRMGINTLAFRLPQHRTFYDVDADCVGINGKIPWKQNRQWAEVIARSGTSLFISARPGVLNEKECAEFRQILLTAAGQAEHDRPVDWEDTDCPELWSDGTNTVRYHWYAEDDELPQSRLNQTYYAQMPRS